MSNEKIIPLGSPSHVTLWALEAKLNDLRNLRDDLTTTAQIAKRRTGNPIYPFESALDLLEQSIERFEEAKELFKQLINQ